MKKHLTFLLSLITVLSMAAPVCAAEKTDSVIDTSRTGSITISYADDADGSNPVTGAEFRFYKIAEIGSYGNYESIIPDAKKTAENGIIKIDGNTEANDVIDAVKTAYTAKNVTNGYTVTTKTDAKGSATADKLPLGLYLAEEVKPADHHFASIPFLFSVPYTENNGWHYSVSVEPKALPASDLVITKTVQGNAGEKNKDFHFIVTFDTNGKYKYTKSDGKTGTIENGGTIILRDGQSATIEMIPVGCSYTVREEEADQNGYRTTSSGTTGKITNKVKSYAKFTNTKDVDKPHEPGKPPKTKTGDSTAPLVWGGVAVGALVLFITLARRKTAGEK